MKILIEEKVFLVGTFSTVGRISIFNFKSDMKFVKSKSF